MTTYLSVSVETWPSPLRPRQRPPRGSACCRVSAARWAPIAGSIRPCCGSSALARVPPVSAGHLAEERMSPTMAAVCGSLSEPLSAIAMNSHHRYAAKYFIGPPQRYREISLGQLVRVNRFDDIDVFIAVVILDGIDFFAKFVEGL